MKAPISIEFMWLATATRMQDDPEKGCVPVGPMGAWRAKVYDGETTGTWVDGDPWAALAGAIERRKATE